MLRVSPLFVYFGTPCTLRVFRVPSNICPLGSLKLTLTVEGYLLFFFKYRAFNGLHFLMKEKHQYRCSQLV